MVIIEWLIPFYLKWKCFNDQIVVLFSMEIQNTNSFSFHDFFLEWLQNRRLGNCVRGRSTHSFYVEWWCLGIWFCVNALRRLQWFFTYQIVFLNRLAIVYNIFKARQIIIKMILTGVKTFRLEISINYSPKLTINIYIISVLSIQKIN